MFRGLLAILTKEFIHIRRDPGTRFIFLIPLIELLIFGYAIETDVKHLSTVVFDLDQKSESRELIQSFENTRYFRVTGNVHSDAELEGAIVSGRAKAGIKIPPDYSEKLARGQPARVQVLIDGSDSSTASRLLNASQAIGLLKSLDRNGLSLESLAVEIRPRLLFNPNLESAPFFVPGLMGIIIQVVTVFLTAFSIVRERERGTLEQLLVTPVSKGGLILGKLLPYCAVGFIQTLLILVLAVLLFGLKIHGSVPLLLLMSWVFLVPALGIGIVISTIARSEGEALQLLSLVMMPSILLSGFIFPRESMPTPIYLLSFLIPVSYYIEILRGIILRGAGWLALWDEALVLALFGAVLMSVSAWRFKKNLG